MHILVLELNFEFVVSVLRCMIWSIEYSVSFCIFWNRLINLWTPGCLDTIIYKHFLDILMFCLCSPCSNIVRNVVPHRFVHFQLYIVLITTHSQSYLIKHEFIIVTSNIFLFCIIFLTSLNEPFKKEKSLIQIVQNII